MLKGAYELRKRDGDDPSDRKAGKLPKTCGGGAPTKSKYGAPLGDEEFEIGHVVRLSFNDRTKSFEFEVEHFFPDDETTHLYWLTWSEMTSFPQYQIAFWFYLRNDHTGGEEFERTTPSSSAVKTVADPADDTEDE